MDVCQSCGTFNSFIVATWYAETYHLLFLSVTPSTKSTKFGGICLVDGFWKWDDIWQIDTGGPIVHYGQDWWTLAQGIPLHKFSRILKGVKKICNTFVIHCLAECDEIWHDEGHFYVAGHLLFWWTLVHFCGSTNFRQQLSRTLLVAAHQNLPALGVWPIDIYSRI